MTEFPKVDDATRAEVNKILLTTIGLDYTGIIRFVNFRVRELQDILFQVMNNLHYKRGAFLGMVDVDTKSEISLALLIASDQIPEQEKIDIFRPLQEIVQKFQAADVVERMPPDLPTANITLLPNRILDSVGSGFRAEFEDHWGNDMTDDLAKEGGNVSKAHYEREASQYNEFNRILAGVDGLAEAEDIDYSKFQNSEEAWVASLVATAKTALKKMEEATVEDPDKDQKEISVGAAGGALPWPSQSDRDEGGYGPDFRESVRKSGARF